MNGEKKAQQQPFNVVIIVILVFFVGTVIISFFVHSMSESSQQMDIKVDAISKATNQDGNLERLEMLNQGFPSMNDPQEPGRFFFDEGNSQLYFINQDGREETVSTDDMRSISVYRRDENGNTLKEIYAPEEVALMMNLGHRFSSKEEARAHLKNSIDATNSYTVVEERKETPTGEKRTLQVYGNSNQELNAYALVPKALADSAGELQASGTGESFIVDNDPVIGMHFNGTVMNRSFTYETKQNRKGEETLVYVSYEPVSSKGPHVTISYRTRPCAPYEVNLFSIRSLEASRLQSPEQETTYNVCLGHKRLDFAQETEESGATVSLFNITSRGLVNVSENQQTLEVGVSNGEIRSTDLQIAQERPHKNYTCIGSLETAEGGLYGDCKYTPYKIWLSVVDTEAKSKETAANVSETPNRQASSGSGLEDFQIGLIIAIIILCGVIIAATWYSNQRDRKK